MRGAADLVGQIDRHAHELGASADEVADGMGGVAFDAGLAVPAHTHELRQRLGIARVGLVPLQGGGGSRMPCVQADNGQAERLAGVIEPRGERPRLQTDTHEVGSVAPQRRGQHIWIAGAFTAPDRCPSLIDDVDGGLFVRDVEGSILGHGNAPARVEDAAIRPHRAPLGICPIQSQPGSRSAHVERTHAWFNRFRRLPVRYERRAEPKDREATSTRPSRASRPASSLSTRSNGSVRPSKPKADTHVRPDFDAFPTT